MSSVPVNALEDEIVVGTKANGVQSSPLRVVSDQEDVEMDDPEDKSPVPPYPKRKRTSIYNELDEDKIEKGIAGEEGDLPRPGTKPKTHGMGGVKGVMLGYWRDSMAPDETDRHGVIGFIDVRDRLRTRIQPTNRSGKNIINEYPLPPGPGGSWVTFERVVFNKHLVNLDHNQVKEYVKIRAEAIGTDEADDEKDANDRAAVKEAIRRVQANPPPETATAPAIAYGPEIPEHAILAHRPEAKKRRTANNFANLGGIEPQPVQPAPTHTPNVPISIQRSPLDLLPGTRPTKILLGYWKGSSEERAEDRHAVFGILGANDMFRVKVTRETRDGRPVLGNFPTGAGALWIHYDEVEFEPHLKHLARPEIKEYVRVRQRQLDEGERPENRIENETKAVFEAQARVTSSFKPDPDVKPTIGFVSANGGGGSRGGGGGSGDDHVGDYSEVRPKRECEGHELRKRRRHFSEPKGASRPARHSLPDPGELRAANRPPPADNIERQERTNTIARREVARIEAAQSRADQRAASREAQATQRDTNKVLFSENMQRLNKVWAAQEANRLKGGVEDAKMYMGVKYERRLNGPFSGKLVSQGTIISIDGEDYVEYRVLTKPTFF